jgi:hypothetical protein
MGLFACGAPLLFIENTFSSVSRTFYQVNSYRQIVCRCPYPRLSYDPESKSHYGFQAHYFHEYNPVKITILPVVFAGDLTVPWFPLSGG